LGDTSPVEINDAGNLHHPGNGTPMMPAFDGNARYNLTNKKVYFPVGSTHAGGLAHELGHADIAKSRFGRAVQNRATATMGSFAAPIGTVTGGISGLSDNKTVQRLGALAPLLTSAPQLGYEAAATIKGLARLRRGGAGGGDLLHAMKALGPGFASYAGSAAMGVGSALTAQRGVQQARFDAEAAKNKSGKVKEGIAGLTPQTQLEQTARIGAPRAAAPAGPSIADQSKPRSGTGGGFGSGIAGAFKGGIGGTGAIGDMKMPSL
jgi:hypothetical protein